MDALDVVEDRAVARGIIALEHARAVCQVVGVQLPASARGVPIEPGELIEPPRVVRRREPSRVERRREPPAPVVVTVAGVVVTVAGVAARARVFFAHAVKKGLSQRIAVVVTVRVDAARRVLRERDVRHEAREADVVRRRRHRLVDRHRRGRAHRVRAGFLYIAALAGVLAGAPDAQRDGPSLLCAGQKVRHELAPVALPLRAEGGVAVARLGVRVPCVHAVRGGDCGEQGARRGPHDGLSPSLRPTAAARLQIPCCSVQALAFGQRSNLYVFLVCLLLWSSLEWVGFYV